jgi:hypothetical protein
MAVVARTPPNPSELLSPSDTEEFLKRLGLWTEDYASVLGLDKPLPEGPPRTLAEATGLIPLNREAPSLFVEDDNETMDLGSDIVDVDSEPIVYTFPRFVPGSPVIAELVPGAPILAPIPGAPPSIAAPPRTDDADLPTIGRGAFTGGSAFGPGGAGLDRWDAAWPGLASARQAGAEGVVDSGDVAAEPESDDLLVPHDLDIDELSPTWAAIFEQAEVEAWPEVDDAALDGHLLDEFTSAADFGPAVPVEFKESATPKDLASSRRIWPMAVSGIVVVALVMLGASFFLFGEANVDRQSRSQLRTGMAAAGSAQTQLRYAVGDENLGLRATVKGVSDLVVPRGEFSVEEGNRITRTIRRDESVVYVRTNPTDRWRQRAESDVPSNAKLSELLIYPTDLLAIYELGVPELDRKIATVLYGGSEVRHERFIARYDGQPSAWISAPRLAALVAAIDGDIPGDIWYDQNGRIRRLSITVSDTDGHTSYFSVDFSNFGTEVISTVPAADEIVQ